MSKWVFHKIPKIMHTYWGASKLSWLRYLTVKTFHLTNPDWRIKVYTPVQTFTRGLIWEQHLAPKDGDNTKDWFDELKNIPNVEIIKVDYLAQGFGDIPDVFRSDLARLKALSTDGGMWSDFDVIHFTSLSEAYFNTEDNKEIDTIVSYTHLRQHFSIGYMFGSANNVFYKDLYNLGVNSLLPQGDRQTFGVILWAKIVSNDIAIRTQYPSLRVHNIELRICYPILYNDMTGILEHNRDVGSDTIALHWYGGHPDSAKWEHLLTPENYTQFDTTLCNCIRKALAYEKV